jgi:hypothetical protein
MPSAIELVMRCASADAELTPALGVLEEACGRRLVNGMPSAPRGIDLVFRCASADHEFSELAGLKNLRDAAIALGTTRASTPGGGAFVAQSALEFVLSQADADGVLDGLRTLVSADAPLGGAADFPMPSRPGTHEGDSRQRDMEPGYRLPALSGSKPQTPTLQRHRLTSDDESLSGALPPITVYESAKRPGSRRYQYRPKPTGEGLARVLAFAARTPECPFGLMALHGAVVAIKRKQPHRLVKIPLGGVWQVQTSLPALAQPPKKVAEHVDAAAMNGPPTEPPKDTVRHGRLSTARRIDRKLEELRIQVSHLNEVRTVRHSHNARLMARTGSPNASGTTGFSSALGGTLSAAGGASQAIGAEALSGTTTSRSGGNRRGNLRGTTRRVVSPNVSVSALGGTIGGPSTLPPVSVVDAIIASRNGTTASKSRGHRDPTSSHVSPSIAHCTLFHFA